MSDMIRELSVVIDISQSVADSLFRFAETVPDAGREVRDIVGTIYGIKLLLAQFKTQCYDPRYSRLERKLNDEIQTIVFHSFRSLEELDKVYCHCVSRRASSRSQKKIWGDILTAFANWADDELASYIKRDHDYLENLIRYIRLRLDPASNKSDLQESARLFQVIRRQASNLDREARRKYQYEYEEVVRPQHPQQRPPLPHSSSVLPPNSNPYPSPPTSYDSPPMRPYSTPVRQAYHPPQAPPPGSHSSYYGHGHGPPLQMPIHQHQIPHYDPSQYTPPISPVTPIGGPAATQHGTPPRVYNRRYSNTPAPERSAWGVSTPPSTPPMPRPSLRNVGVGRTGSSVKNSSDWWAHVFDNNKASSGSDFNIPETGSMCYGLDVDNLNLSPDDVEIIRVGLDNDLTLRLFRNERTSGVKVVCTVGGNGGSWNGRSEGRYRHQYCVDATLLTIKRVGSAIHLIRRTIMWACLYFNDYENLTLFYQTFLGLRHQAPEAPLPEESEFWHRQDEELLFAGKIEDQRDIKTLRLLKDKSSGAMRIAAAQIDDEDEITVWTAFITNSINDHDWMQQVSHNTLILRDLRLFSFSACFDTRTLPIFELKFQVPSDVQAFMSGIRKEAQMKRMRGLHGREPRERDGYRRSPTVPPGAARSYFP